MAELQLHLQNYNFVSSQFVLDRIALYQISLKYGLQI